jgi:hypothetical protein
MLLQVRYDEESRAEDVPAGSALEWVQPEAYQLAARARKGNEPSWLL